jgi:hypothetical protein
MQTKIILAIAAVALVLPPCVTGNNGVVPSNCINSTTGQPYCYDNGAGIYCNNGYETGICQNGGCYGYGTQNQNQNQYGAGIIDQNGYGYGMGRCR